MIKAPLFFTAAGLILSSIAFADQETMLEHFAIAPEFEATLWADTELIHSPTAIDVDAKGRVWVTEDLENSGKSGPHARIKILADTDGDGKADSAKLFGPTYESKPLGIAVFDNVIVVSMAPNIHVYTDVNRNDVFEPDIDKEEIIAHGFHGKSHDHGLHAVVPGPSGKWYVNHGNIGADVTMADGRQFHASSYYSQNPESIGKKSHDGRLYVGGFGLRMNPDGSGAEVIFQNTRNTHSMLVTSFGDVLHGDNDDPAHARAAWAMEHSNFGYAALEDGNRSWEDSAKSWEEKIVSQDVRDNAYERRRGNGIRQNEGHWREHFPGVTPPGNVWGSGAPTGDYMVEGDELGRKLRGRYLVCESVHRAIFSFLPELRDAQIEMVDLDKSLFDAERNSENVATAGFAPTDITSGTDGSLFVSDWNSTISFRASGNEIGGIFRITRKDSPHQLPKIDFSTTEGLLSALKNPAPGVRWVAQDRLKRQDGIYEDLLAFYKANSDNPFYQARALFIMAQIEDERGTAFVKSFLESDEPRWQIAAIRALRFAEREPLLPVLTQLASDPSPAVRVEAMVSLRGAKFDDLREPLKHFIAGYDGKNRWYLEALGILCDDYAIEVYDQLIQPLQPEPTAWNERQRNLAWRNRSPQALTDLATSLTTQPIDLPTFRKYAYTYALCYTDEERRQNAAFMKAFAEHEAFQGEDYQLVIREFLEKDINDPEPKFLTQDYVFPKTFGAPTELAPIKEISALAPDIDNGQAKVAMCLICHQVGGNGVAFGPDLTNWGQARDIPTIIQALVDPSKDLAHGYEKPIVVTHNEHRLEGIARGYSWHAGAVRVKTVGGITLKVPIRSRTVDVTVEKLKKHSWMPSASDMGLSSQDVRDIAEYLNHDIASEVDAGETALITPAFSKGDGPGWIELSEKDFINVNCDPDTWKWEEGHVFCTGKPVGVIRYHQPLTDFELSCEWMHTTKGGNSGIFVWATPESIKALDEGKQKRRLPHGIEVQVLDLGYREVYESKFKKKGDWFTSHGDVFAVGPDIKMRPFPPVGPKGLRSFPTKETTLGAGKWNHYYVQAIAGTVRLWVNGEEVSGGDQISPASGYLCLESERAPVEFKNIRLRVHPSPPSE